jgi:hypothetical protein
MSHFRAKGPRIRMRGLILAILLAGPAPLRSEEGMWTFDQPPLPQIQAVCGFAPDRAWLDHLRLATLRFPNASGAFVSRDGLVLTNHHVAHAWLEKLSDAAHDYVRDGFTAPDRASELRVPGLEVRTLMLMEDVTAALEAAGPREREAALARLVREAERRTGYACEEVRLYQGGETWIYGYEVHDDVRLVLAPEYAIAAFGKGWDNFTYPRHDLDFCLFRVYRRNRPYHPRHFLRFSANGLKNGDPALVAGYPGRTSRMETLAQLEAAREVFNPLRIRELDRARGALRAFAATGAEPARLASAQLFSLENTYKSYVHENEGLRNAEAMARVAQAERDFQARVEADPALRAAAGQSWERIRQAVQARAGIAPELLALDGCGSRALGFAQKLVRWQLQAGLPETQRAPGYRTARDLERAKAGLQFPERLDAGQEEASLEAGLRGALEELGPEHPVVAALLEGRPPRERARALLAATRLRAAEARRELLREPEAVLTGADPLLVLARRLEQLAAPYRRLEAQSQETLSEQRARLAKARFALFGHADYPDANFSLRLSFGSVAPYAANGTLAQPFTTFGGLFDRADAWGPEAEDHAWALPPRWQARRTALEPSTPFDFITTNDITGGSSGSPVVDRRGDLVGLVFDGNIASVAGRYYYDLKRNRAVAVDARAILESLAKVYEVPALVQELLPGAAQARKGPALAADATNP